MGKEKSEMVPLNAKIPADLRRRMLIAKANTGRKIQELLTEWIEAGLATVEAGKHKGNGK